MNNYKSFSKLKEELGDNYDFKLYEMGISALKEIENLQQENKQLKEKQLEDLIYEIICDIENDFDNRLTVHDIYKKLVKVRDITRDANKESEVAFEDLL